VLSFMARRLAWSALVLVLVAITAYASIRVLRPELNRGGSLAEGVADYLVAVLAGGAFCAARNGTLAARALEAFAMVVLCTPVYLVGLASLLLFSPEFGYVPLPAFFDPHVYEPLTEDPWNWLRGLAVPWIVVGGPLAAMCLRMTRSAVVDAMHEDYMRTAVAKGLTRRRVFRAHGLPVAYAPVASMTSVTIPLMVSNVVLVEQVFSVPGTFGSATDAVANGDFPVLQALAIVGGVLVVAGGVAVDLVLALADPRIRTSGRIPG
jgi:peptide/nickel transport system permease protein